jgi:hypothetical protein
VLCDYYKGKTVFEPEKPYAYLSLRVCGYGGEYDGGQCDLRGCRTCGDKSGIFGEMLYYDIWTSFCQWLQQYQDSKEAY